ncbi:Uncharacterised protein [Mycobacteroides abscessus]|nr:Uncharacterised protein [Mycobacteroides abscessus]
MFWTSEPRGPAASDHSDPVPARFVPASPASENDDVVPAP